MTSAHVVCSVDVILCCVERKSLLSQLILRKCKRFSPKELSVYCLGQELSVGVGLWRLCRPIRVNIAAVAHFTITMVSHVSRNHKLLIWSYSVTLQVKPSSKVKYMLKICQLVIYVDFHKLNLFKSTQHWGLKIFFLHTNCCRLVYWLCFSFFIFCAFVYLYYIT